LLNSLIELGSILLTPEQSPDNAMIFKGLLFLMP